MKKKVAIVLSILLLAALFLQPAFAEEDGFLKWAGDQAADLVSGGKDEKTETGAAWKIDLGQTSVKIYTGGFVTVDPKVVSASDGKEIAGAGTTWTSSDPAVAEVQNNKIIGKKTGNAILTCRAAEDESVSATLLVRVAEPVSKVSFAEKNIELSCNKGGSQTYTIKPVLEPAGAGYDELVYSSGNESIASVDRNGKITAHQSGTTKITLNVKLNGSSKTLKASVTVKVVKMVTSISGTGSLEVTANKTKKITATVSPEDATNKKLSWKSSNESVATVDASGNVKGKKDGSCTITCTATDGSGISKKFTVTVIQPVTAVKTIMKSNGNYEMSITQTLSLYRLFTVEPYNATNSKLLWDVSRTDEVTFNNKMNYSIKKDVLTFHNPGVYKITATSTDGSNKSASYTVRVYPEDKMTLSLPYVSWRDSGYDNLRLTFDIHNEKYGVFVDAVELYVYCQDVWGNDIYGTLVYYKTTQKTIAPGKTVKSDAMVIPDRSKIYKIYCGIHQIKYSDGSFVTINDVDYTNYTYR